MSDSYNPVTTSQLLEIFCQYVRENLAKGVNGNGYEVDFVLPSASTDYWTRKKVDDILGYEQPSSELIVRCFSRVFSILVYIGHPHEITWFLQDVRLLDDTRLPFDTTSFPPACRWLASFLRTQWMFIPLIFSEDKIFDSVLPPQTILPVNYVKPLTDRCGDQNTAAFWEVKVHPEANRVTSESQPVVFKIFKGFGAEELFKAETKVHLRLRTKHSQYITKHFGSFSFKGKHKYIIVLEYAAGGSLQDFLRTTDVPVTPEDIRLLWRRLLQLLYGLHALKEFRRPDGAVDSFLDGVHQDIQPANILVFPENGSESPFDVRFKLANFGLTEIGQVSTSSGTMATEDRGNRMYIAPESVARFPVQLAVKTDIAAIAEIWALGAVFSDVLVWSISGEIGREKYRLRRQAEISSQPQLKDRKIDACFHNKLERLKAVDEVHHLALDDRRQRDDVSPHISELILDFMLVNHRERLSAIQIKALADSKLMEIQHDSLRKDDYLSGHRSTSGSSVGHAISSGLFPRPEQFLQPLQRRDAVPVWVRDLEDTKPLFATKPGLHHPPKWDESVQYPESLISTLASTCTSSFYDTIQVLSKEKDERYEVIFRKFEKRFLDWAAYLGVFAEGNGSLDYRLKRHPQYRSLILLLLDMMNMSINQTITEANDPSEPSSDESSQDELDARKIEAESIQKSINELDRLAIHIRQSSTSSLDTRVKTFVARKPTEVSSYEFRATLAVNGLYPDAPESLRRYLSKWMTHRYMKLLYWRSHDRKLRADSRYDRQQRQNLKQVPLQPAPLNEKLSSLPRQLVQDEDPVPPKASGSKASGGTSFLSGTRASELGSQIIIPTVEGKMPHRERAVASTVLETGAKFPSPPKFGDGEDRKPCPLCRKIFLKDDFADNRWWREVEPKNLISHVNNDLMPFLCVSNKCMESPAFTSRTAWKRHIAQDHDGVWFSGPKFDSQGTSDAAYTMNICALCCLPLAEIANLQASNSRAPDPDLSSPKESTGSPNKVPSKTVRFDVAEPDLPVAVDREAASSAERTMILDHIASHLQFLALLTPRLSSEKLGDGERDAFSSDQGLSSGQGTGERSTLADHFAATKGYRTQLSEGDAPFERARHEEIATDQAMQQALEIETEEKVDWSIVANLHRAAEGDSKIEHMQRVRAECNDLLDAALATAVESCHHRRHFLELASDTCRSITAEMITALQAGGEVGAFVDIFVQEIPRGALRDFFHELLVSIDVAKDMMLVDYCTEQVWDYRPYQHAQELTEERLASRRLLLSLLALSERPLGILKAIKTGVSDLGIPLSATTLVQMFPAWEDTEVLSFMRLQEGGRPLDPERPGRFYRPLPASSRLPSPAPQPPPPPPTPLEQIVTIDDVYSLMERPGRSPFKLVPRPDKSTLIMKLPGMEDARRKISTYKGRDQIMIIDDYSSMKQYIDRVKVAARVVSYVAKTADDDGMELYAASEAARKPRICATSSQVEKEIGKMKTVEGKCDMGACLNHILDKVLIDGKKVKPTSIYIYTDAAWEPRTNVEQAIYRAIDHLIETEQPTRTLMLQFVQFGRDAKGTRHLRCLDDDCTKQVGSKTYDIVDTRHCDDPVPKIVLGSISASNDWE